MLEKCIPLCYEIIKREIIHWALTTDDGRFHLFKVVMCNIVSFNTVIVN